MDPDCRLRQVKFRVQELVSKQHNYAGPNIDPSSRLIGLWSGMEKGGALNPLTTSWATEKSRAFSSPPEMLGWLLIRRNKSCKVDWRLQQKLPSLSSGFKFWFGVLSFYYFSNLLVCKNQENLDINGTPLQFSCLENPMDGGAWWAAVHGVTRSWTRLSDFTFVHWRRKWQPTPVVLPGESQGRVSLVGCCLGVAQSRTRLKRLSSSHPKED